MNPLHQIVEQLPQIEESIGYKFKDKNLLVLSFVHRSFVNENKNINNHNERLEFLGDSVLGIIVAEYLYRNFSAMSEGDLSYLRSRLVEATSCVTYVHKLKIGQFLLLGKGERANDGRGRDSILADFLEALIGAIYLDGGIEAAKNFFFRNFSTNIEIILNTPISNWKSLLQDYCQKNLGETPKYEVLEESGPDHSKTFLVSVHVQKKELGRGVGASKKEAQQAAAHFAIAKLNLE